MLETQLGYDEVITKKAQETVELIFSLDFLEDIAKLEEFMVFTAGRCRWRPD